jgi:putative hydrolase
MDPVVALDRVATLLEKKQAGRYKEQAFRKAADAIRDLPVDELRALAERGRIQSIPGVGSSTGQVIEQALQGDVPEYLARLEAEAAPDQGPGAEIRSLLKGDLHLHSDWSDGGARIDQMARKAADLGHEYMALTDHSPRLTVAKGLTADRLRAQLDLVHDLNAELAPFRILTGIEVDILEDGSLDQEPELLDRLDVVVASVHSKLKMDAPAMTRRMIKAVENPHADVLGHCTGRLVTGGRGMRAESKFDAEKVFTACRDNGTAVEINSRPERRDPPTRLLNLALEIGCLFSIDTDSHAPGQLEFLGYGAQRALDAKVPVDRIVNTWTAEKLLDWTTS